MGIFLIGNQIDNKRTKLFKLPLTGYRHFGSRSADHIFRCLVPVILHTSNEH